MPEPIRAIFARAMGRLSNSRASKVREEKSRAV